MLKQFLIDAVCLLVGRDPRSAGQVIANYSFFLGHQLLFLLLGGITIKLLLLVEHRADVKV